MSLSFSSYARLKQQLLSAYRQNGALNIKINELREQLNLSREVNKELRRMVVANGSRPPAPDPEEHLVRFFYRAFIFIMIIII